MKIKTKTKIISIFLTMTLVILICTITVVAEKEAAVIYKNLEVEEYTPSFYHQHIYKETIIPPTCKTEGYSLFSCNCGYDYKKNYISLLEHDFNEWEITTIPNLEQNGIETRICSVCNESETREFICPHEHITTNIQEATCTSEGKIEHICDLCKKIIKTEIINKTSHTFSSWKIKTNATPEKTGEKIRTCECGKEEFKNYEFEPSGLNSIYIESANINKPFAITGFSQENVDQNDICYTKTRLDENNPIVLGHNTGSLKKLYNTKIGSLIYVYLDRELSIYEVIVSEKAYDKKTDIVGVDTGEPLLKKYDTPHLHLYTCYKEPTNQYTRWLVLAKKIL